MCELIGTDLYELVKGLDLGSSVETRFQTWSRKAWALTKCCIDSGATGGKSRRDHRGVLFQQTQFGHGIDKRAETGDVVGRQLCVDRGRELSSQIGRIYAVDQEAFKTRLVQEPCSTQQTQA